MRPSGSRFSCIALAVLLPVLASCTSSSLQPGSSGFSFAELLGSAYQSDPGSELAVADLPEHAILDASADAEENQTDKAEAAEVADEKSSPVVPETAAPESKKGLLTAFWSGLPRSQAAAQAGRPERTGDLPATSTPELKKVSAVTEGRKESSLARTFREGEDALPGVRTDSLFEITRKTGLEDDYRDIDLNEDDGGSIRVASAAGLARLAPNGLLKQRDDVDVSCFKPSLVRMLRTIEHRFGRRVIVTSGYRGPDHNRRVRGARNSLHMSCAAADIQVPGISKWDLARYVRSLPGRGGVGTYCHTHSIHVDVGPERDWNWKCRRNS